MKSFLITLLFCSTAVHSLSKDENADLTELAKQLYEVEDKLDHLLYHFSHDVTRHEYKTSRLGTVLRAAPKNPNSIHQKLKLIDNMNQGLGRADDWHSAGDNSAYNLSMGGPAMALPTQLNEEGVGRAR